MRVLAAIAKFFLFGIASALKVCVAILEQLCVGALENLNVERPQVLSNNWLCVLIYVRAGKRWG
jgi:hypothetical protein